ncbi:MAG: LLM class flavin-dependent oxidoreductase [Pseudomonadales bacterium]|nr:LLM class flavin-dependent oxidoreductase [Pseudomonadales bacterium]MBO6702312.1 LLM class flavin-dependent oxidoreductase [Pseudomonadales bacterium]MBO7005550.1 LLM class flavin-dependent oxidoreductase [Pseudomonadales bacterium]
MKIGISVTSSHKVDDPREGARYMIERAKASREAGLDTLFVGDHHVTPYPYYQNNVILARMLAEWGDKPFGALYLLPLWHPVTLAEQIGTLASLASGPFIMQCGLGDERQGKAMGIDMSKRVGMFVASINTMRALWRGEAVDEDRYWNISQARISPVPSEPVDIWIGSVADKAVERTARIGEAWLASPGLTPAQAGEAIIRYKQYCAEYKRTPTATAIRRDIYVGATSEEAKQVVEPYISGGYRGISEDALMYGSPEDVAEQIKVLEGQGYTDIIVRNLSADHGQCLNTIHRLAEVKAHLS